MGRTVKGMRVFTVAQRREMRTILIEKYGLYCQICLQKGISQQMSMIDMAANRNPRSFSIDHIVALADGGANTIDNMWPTHIRCNENKSSNYGLTRRTGQAKISSAPRLAYSSSSW